MDRHLGPERGDVFRKLIRCLSLQHGNPMIQGFLRSAMQAFDFRVRKLVCHRYGRKPCSMENFIRVSVPNPAKEIRVGQRALESVVALRKRARKRRRGAPKNFKAAPVERAQRLLSLQQVQSRPLLSTRFSEHEGAVRKVERCEVILPVQPCRWFAPMQPACDHEVQDEPEFIFETENDMFSQSPKAVYF